MRLYLFVLACTCLHLLALVFVYICLCLLVILFLILAATCCHVVVRCHLLTSARRISTPSQKELYIYIYIYMKLPKEMGLGTNVVARQVRCVYGMRDAGKLWEDTYTQAMEHAGFTTGVGKPVLL